MLSSVADPWHCCVCEGFASLSCSCYIFNLFSIQQVSLFLIEVVEKWVCLKVCLYMLNEHAQGKSNIWDSYWNSSLNPKTFFKRKEQLLHAENMFSMCLALSPRIPFSTAMWAYFLCVFNIFYLYFTASRKIKLCGKTYVWCSTGATHSSCYHLGIQDRCWKYPFKPQESTYLLLHVPATDMVLLRLFFLPSSIDGRFFSWSGQKASQVIDPLCCTTFHRVHILSHGDSSWSMSWFSLFCVKYWEKRKGGHLSHCVLGLVSFQYDS